ncbi:MAG: hypothetical protein M3144_10105, partial [Actinomycetota bacterium]|nr:hypothetical protein [Actinomycetota bacterium]
LLPPETDSFLAAEALAELLASDGLRAELTRRGRQRLAAFDLEKANATFLDHVLDVTDGSRRR